MNKRVDQYFTIAVTVKFIDGVLEVLGAGLLLFIKPAQIDLFVLRVMSHELSRDPQDIVANYLIQLANHLSVGAQTFASFYLLSHGLIKILLVYLLLKRQVRYFPAAIIILLLSIVYEAYRFSHTHSKILLTATCVDMIVVALIFFEYSRLKDLTRYPLD